MTFASVLFATPDHRARRVTPEAPAFFGDLNLDQVIDAVTAGWEEYNLAPYFYLCPADIDTITYRQAIMREIECKGLLKPIRSFAQHMRAIRHHLKQAEKLTYYRYQQARWILDAIQIYCTAVRGLLHDLTGADLRSTGLVAFREYLQSYVQSEQFTVLSAETEQLLANLSGISYGLVIKDLRVEVRRYDGEADYSAEIERTFARFRQGDVEDYRRKFSDAPQNDHVQEMILERLARLYPDTFSALDRYCSKHAVFLDDTIATFDREVQFYAAYLSFIARLKSAGLKFCYPHVSAASKEVCNYEGFDLALATKLVQAGSPVVCNDFYLHDGERIIVVTGPNQSGKTTFARTFGQLHYLASIGCPVPGREARLFLFDRLFTHFEKVEDIRDLRGHLEDDLLRVHAILRQATPNSIIILNETFSSTTLQDAIALGRKVLETIIDLDALCVSVTFIDEFASLHPKVVSMVGAVLPQDPTVRTFVIERKAADGLAYAISIADKYGLTYQRLKDRLRK
jgi:DNA mismatch repair ATPase MutS